MATIFGTTAWQVTQRGAGANMSVDIAVGGGNIGLSTSAYPYWGFSDAVNNKTVTAADPSNPRKDIVVVYIDLAVVDSTSSNNPGALKFAVVAGTPAGSPSDPSDATIQAAVGASNPWIKLARITLPANATSVVDAYITDLRRPIGWMGNLWGGSNNTNGHTVPNVADDIVALLAATQTLTNKTLNIASNTFNFSAGVQSQTNTGAGGGTMYYINLGGIRLLWVVCPTKTVTSAGFGDFTVTFPTSFFTTIQHVTVSAYYPSNVPVNAYVENSSVSTTSARGTIYNGNAGSITSGISMFVIGT